ncbi:hypothetical protein [Candidatus Aalborgicola defluviihabitans]|jgi:TRAP-type uncharacterized transport system fused permease subunit|uniref:hypothetical protein n=1 Tax=Candidatus Aalborgicola defluviihabitans TaxID=3386187 RepID=UPI001E189C78|nr:hypothetical protein [Burkholderiales bacterium]MBK6570333.1 hypothetical protein [Burkholderiales bacterium]MBK7279336.1 hypothetical protein [Burkholderiales bacterium]MBL0243779.1 hypothetical protein [Rhodoferax sp.]
MTAQNLIVSAIVVACSVYALWVLMPSSARRFLAVRLVHLPLGSKLQSVFQRAAKPSAGCDCSGCDAVVDKRGPSNKH